MLRRRASKRERPPGDRDMPLTDDQEFQLEKLKLQYDAEAKEREDAAKKEAERQKHKLAFIHLIWPAVMVLTNYWVADKQAKDITKSQKDAAVIVKSDLAAATAKTTHVLAEIKESADVAALQSSSASDFAAKDFYATTKLIEDMPPAKSADPEEQ